MCIGCKANYDFLLSTWFKICFCTSRHGCESHFSRTRILWYIYLYTCQCYRTFCWEGDILWIISELSVSGRQASNRNGTMDGNSSHPKHFYMPGTVLGTLHLMLRVNPVNRDYFFSLCRQRNWGPDRLNNIPKTSRLVSERARIQT